MRQGITRWTIYLLCLCIVGPAAGAMVGMLRAADGSHVASPLFCTTPLLGIGVALTAMGLALVMGLLAGKLVNVSAGYTAAGLVLAWAAWGSGEVHTMIRSSQSGGPLLAQAAEGAIFGILTIAIAFAIWKFGTHEEHGPGQVKGLSASLPVGIFAGALAAWLIAISPLKGQAVFGAIAAGVGVAAAARLMDPKVALAPLAIAMAALAILGPLSGYAMAGGQAVHAAYKGSLFPLANITALDWIAGALLGLPLGAAWAGSMMEKKS